MFLSHLEKGTSIFIDANIFIYHFSKESRFNQACSNFLESIEAGAIIGFTSISIVQEVIHRMMIMEAVGFLPGIKPKDIVKRLKRNSEIVKKLVNHQSIPSKIASFNLEIVSPNIETIIRSQQMKKRYGFLSNDALTLQIMEDLNIKNLASNDTDFERVDFITLYRPSESLK
ncbi:MAG: PIN domain-containing protein [Deltaproteobacteria bacterium]|nr:PIN domain-containing protein [Deltaproteobacteria bacterium]